MRQGFNNILTLDKLLSKTKELKELPPYIVVDHSEAFDWREPSPPLQLRRNLRLCLQELLSGRKREAIGVYMKQLLMRCEIQGIQDDILAEVDFRAGDVSYVSHVVAFQDHVQRLKDDLPMVEVYQDHVTATLQGPTAEVHPTLSPALICRMYTTPDGENNRDYKQLLRFVAACNLKARSVTPFVLELQRMYENRRYTFLLYEVYFGTIASVMRSLQTQRLIAGGSLQDGRDRDDDDIREDIGSALPPQYTLYFSACILQALRHLADLGIAVNRMTTESVALTYQQIPVLTDFLHASRCGPESRHVLTRSLPELPTDEGFDEFQGFDGNFSGRGSGDAWIAPELRSDACRGENKGRVAMHGRVDVWNFGTFVLMMAVGTETFRHVRDTEHRTAISPTGTAVSLQPCSHQMAGNRQCGLNALSLDLQHLVSAALAESPTRRPTLRILESASYYAKVNFMHLNSQVDAFGINLDELLGYAKSSTQQQKQTQQDDDDQPQQQQLQLQPQGDATLAKRGAPLQAAKQPLMQMLEQMNDVEELLARMGMQAVTITETVGP